MLTSVIADLMINSRRYAMSGVLREKVGRHLASRDGLPHELELLVVRAVPGPPRFRLKPFLLRARIC